MQAKFGLMGYFVCRIEIHILLDMLFVNDYKCLASVVLVTCDIGNIKAKQKPALPYEKNRKCPKWRLNYAKRAL